RGCSRTVSHPGPLSVRIGAMTWCSFRSSRREQLLRVRVGVGEDVVGVVGAGGEREALAQLAVLDDDAEPVALAVPEERDGDPVVLAEVELFQGLAEGERGHGCLLFQFGSARLRHGPTVRPAGPGSHWRRPQTRP